MLHYPLTVLLSAVLPFLVQPLMGKVVLPWFGGAPTVWSISMLFFQSLLLVGYAYSHGIVSRLPLRRQSLVHITGLGVSLILLLATFFAWETPITPDKSWRFGLRVCDMLEWLRIAGLRLKRLLPLWIIVALVSGCAPATLPLPPTLAPVPTPTITPTPTGTPTPTRTRTPTPTSTPTPRPTPTPTPTPWPTEGSTPEQQGMDSELLTGIFDYIEQQKVDVHGVLVVRNGYTVVEAYYPPYGPNIRHSTASVGKSFTGALVGIAIREGYIEGVDQKVADFFPNHSDLQNDPLKQAMTIEHLLTMTSGLDWPESAASYSSSQNIMNQMMRSTDWVRFVLDRPMAAAPGTTFNYSSGASHLLSAIIQEATGMRTFSFAREYLFEPLGISRVHWPSDPQGIVFGAGGLWLTPRDMAKFGQLYLQGGVWNGKQVVPAEWVEASVARQVNAHGAASYYGYQWWVRGSGIYAAHGYRGKRIFVLPDLEMVVVFTADLSGNAPSVILSSFIIPAAQSPEPLPENPQGVALLEARISEIEQSEP